MDDGDTLVLMGNGGPPGSGPNVFLVASLGVVAPQDAAVIHPGCLLYVPFPIVGPLGPLVSTGWAGSWEFSTPLVGVGGVGILGLQAVVNSGGQAVWSNNAVYLDP